MKYKRGLSVGAPVTLLGLPAGEVTDVGLEIDPVTRSLRGRVNAVSFPERLLERLRTQQAARGRASVENLEERRTLFQRMVEQHGLRAQLRSGNLFTGQLYVALDFFPDVPRATIDWSRQPVVLPVVPSTVPDLEAKITAILAKLDALPYESIGAEALKVLDTADGTLKDAGTALNRVGTDMTPELRTTLEEARRLIASADELLTQQLSTTLDGLDTTLTEVTRVLEGLRGPIATADQALKNADRTLLGPTAPTQQELHDALQELAAAARSLRNLMDYLDRHPEALIWGKTGQAP